MPPQENVMGEKVSIRDSPNHGGKGMFATSFIGLDEEVASVWHPLVAILDTDRLKDTCYYCLTSPEMPSLVMEADQKDKGGSDGELKKCSACKIVRYCSKTHAQHAWTQYHRKECSLFVKLYPKILPSPVRAALRLLLRHKSDMIPLEEWDRFIALETHLDQFGTSDDTRRWENLGLMATASREYSGTRLSPPQVLSICARLLINSFTLMTSTNDPLGIYLHPFFARANHSCAYNATVLFNAHGAALIVPVRPISANEEILLPYIDTTQGYQDRQRDLKSRYFFTCTCTLCRLGPTTYRDLLHPLTNPTTQPSDSRLPELETRARDLLAAARKNDDSDQETSSVQQLQSALRLLASTNRWPLTRQPSPEIRQSLIHALIRQRDYVDAFLHAAVLHYLVDPQLYPSADPIHLVHIFVLFRLVEAISGDDSDFRHPGSGAASAGAGVGVGPPLPPQLRRYLIQSGIDISNSDSDPGSGSNSGFSLTHLAVDLLHEARTSFPGLAAHSNRSNSNFNERTRNMKIDIDLYEMIQSRKRAIDEVLPGGLGVEGWWMQHKERITINKALLERLLQHVVEREVRDGTGGGGNLC